MYVGRDAWRNVKSVVVAFMSKKLTSFVNFSSEDLIFQLFEDSPQRLDENPKEPH